MINKKINYSDYDWPVVVVGSGPAGIILSLELEKFGIPVLLIEMGGDKVTTEVSSLYETESSGTYDYDGRSSRLPVFGGTSGHWGGQCTLLDNKVFEPIKNKHHPFWNAGKGLLDDYYDIVLPYFDINISYQEAKSLELREKSRSISSEDKIFFSKSNGAKRFSDFKDNIYKSKLIHLLSGSRVERIVSNRATVEKLLVRDIDNGREFPIKGGLYVFCGGAIETTRVMLNSVKTCPALGVNPNIGRNFYDHLGVYSTIEIYTNSRSTYEKYKWRSSETKGMNFMHAFGLSSAELDSNDLIPVGITHVKIQNNKGRFVRDFKYVVRGLLYISNHHYSPKSNLFLSKKTDRFGMKKIDIRFNVNNYYHELIDRSIQLIARNITSKTGYLVKFKNVSAKEIHKSSHHQGGLLMSSSSKHGVVDKNLKVFGVDNLFISSSGVFPTTGISNPTIHIGALSAKLAENLSSVKQKYYSNMNTNKGIFFVTSGANDLYRSEHFSFNYGWNKLETSGRWTTGKSLLNVTWPSDQVDSVHLFISFYAYTHAPDLNSQIVSIQTNDRDVYKNEVKGGEYEVAEINIKREKQSNNFELTFVLPKAGRPSHYNPGYSDNRELGVYLQHIYYEFY